MAFHQNRCSLVAAGCLLGTGDVYPSVVYEGAGSVFLMSEIDAARPAAWATTRRGISFTPQVGTTGPLLLGNRFEVDGESIARHSVVRGPGERLALAVEAEDEVAGLSIATAGADFDRDGQLDVAALVLLASPDAVQEARVFIALGATLEGARLSGLSVPLASDEPGTLRFLDSQLLTADLDGDGYDELVIASRTHADIYDLKP